jgi:Transposase DDE domain
MVQKRGMSRFLRYIPDQAYSLPPSVKDELGADHLCFFVHEVVERLDLGQFEEAYSQEGGELARPDEGCMGRKATVEPVLGVLKQQRGMRQFRTRGLAKVAAEFTRATLAYDLTRLHALGHR